MVLGSPSDAWGGSPLTTTAAKPCDSCKAAPSSIFCRADSAFLCLGCDTKIHAANKLASRHARVWVCEVCEQSPAVVTCRADAASLCAACDRDIHSANPLARRHDRVPIAPFYDAAAAASKHESATTEYSSPTGEKYSAADDVGGYGDLFGDVDSYLDLDLMVGGGGGGGADQKMHGHVIADDEVDKVGSGYGGGDGVVPVGKRDEFGSGQYHHGQVVDGFPTYDVDFGSKGGYLFNFAAQSMSQSVTSSSLDVGVVPEHNPGPEGPDPFAKTEPLPVPVSGIDREARVLRYREKRKNRKFEKTIRYASRKAYAETRPRIKGRFAKRSELDVDCLLNAEASYGVVPTF